MSDLLLFIFSVSSVVVLKCFLGTVGGKRFAVGKRNWEDEFHQGGFSLFYLLSVFQLDVWVYNSARPFYWKKRSVIPFST